MNILKDRVFILLHVTILILVGLLSWGFAYSHDDYIRYLCLKFLRVSKTGEGDILASVIYWPLLVYVYGFYKAFKAKSQAKIYTLLIILGFIFYGLCYLLFAGILLQRI